MTKSTSRRVVVLRDIPSNLVEEAIFVLKSETPELGVSNKNSLKVEKKEFVLMKEVEMIIDEFINKRVKPVEIKQTSKIHKKWQIDFLINVGLVSAIVIFAFLIIKIL